MTAMRLTMRNIMDDYLRPSSSQRESYESNPLIGGKYFALVRNIPNAFRSAHLRFFFSDFVENARFDCFHFKHRPEIQKKDTAEKTSTNCCIVRFSNSEDRAQFMEDYQKRNWVDYTRPSLQMARRCFITPIKVSMSKNTAPNDESEDDSQVTASDLLQMIELRPPQPMPRGNVGTPTEYFFEQIAQCTLPPSIIKKLGLKKQRKKRKFGAVPFEYATKTTQRNKTDEATTSDAGTEPSAETSKDSRNEDSCSDEEAPETDEEADDDDDQCEEWERHEALHDDVTEQERTKEKKFEQEMEIVWEKGGPGLVWNMDKEYWDEREKGTDCDWLWADDWDVDYSVYYEGKSAGDVDSRQAVEIREDEAKRNGHLVGSAFRKPAEKSKARKRRHSGSDVVDIEKYTKGVGSRLMKRMGWAPGIGLGSRGREGRVIPVALGMGEKAQVGIEKVGLGFRGEKMSRTVSKQPQRHSLITKYDTYKDKDESRDKIRRVGDQSDISNEVLWRRKEPTYLKHY